MRPSNTKFLPWKQQGHKDTHGRKVDEDGDLEQALLRRSERIQIPERYGEREEAHGQAEFHLCMPPCSCTTSTAPPPSRSTALARSHLTCSARVTDSSGCGGIIEHNKTGTWLCTAAPHGATHPSRAEHKHFFAGEEVAEAGCEVRGAV